MARILVVDDSSTVRRVVRRTLSQGGHEVAVAVDGKDALERAQALVPDLVLVDFVMPRMNGLMFVQAMRLVDNLAQVPVVLMSAKADRIGDGFLNQTGALDAITKPFSPEALLAVTGHALSRSAEDSRAAGASEPLGRISQPPPEPLEARVAEVDGDGGLDPTATAATHAELESAAAAVRTRLVEVAGRVEAATPTELFEAVRGIADLVPGEAGEVALSGQLEHVSLGEVLQMLTHQRQTGVLEVRKRPSTSGRATSICLRDGAVHLALGRAHGAEFRLGRYLLKEELVEREDLERVLERPSRDRALLGTRLVKLGYISAEELRRLLTQQTSELVYEALRWRRGGFRFLRFATRPEADAARLGLPLASLLMEGLRRVDEWRLIEEQIPRFDLVPRRDAEALRSFDEGELSADERRVLGAIDGIRTVREIVETTDLASFDACKILFQLTTSRLVRV